MYICRVRGKCVATIKSSNLAGRSLMIVQRLGEGDTLSEKLLVAVDTIGCSVNETVLVTVGCSASELLGNGSAVDMAIIGIVDTYDY